MEDHLWFLSIFLWEFLVPHHEFSSQSAALWILERLTFVRGVYPFPIIDLRPPNAYHLHLLVNGLKSLWIADKIHCSGIWADISWLLRIWCDLILFLFVVTSSRVCPPQFQPSHICPVNSHFLSSALISPFSNLSLAPFPITWHLDLLTTPT